MIAATGLVACTAPGPDPARELAAQDAELAAVPVDYAADVQPVLEQRCVVCHGCYDAPCQLKLSSHEGARRGGNPAKVYNGARIVPADPTRLFVDAQSIEEWRDKGFHPVLGEQGETPGERLDESVLYRMLSLKRRNPQPSSGLLPESFDLALDRKQSCPTADSFDGFAARHPLWGMPYAMPDLAEAEYRTLVAWVAAGAPGPAPAEPSAAARPRIVRWETFLNGASTKERLMSRYLYEHLFVGHIHLEGTDDREFYRLVRSRTPPGEPIEEIATVRPFDDPGGPLHYRLRLYHPTIVAKDHVVYEWSEARMARYRALFLEPDYPVESFPSYSPEVAANPITAFSAIPVSSRYRFLLDDARFFIEGFMKGPVCRGQVALNVIEDHFWVFFVDPDSDTSTMNQAFLDEMADHLRLPAERGSAASILSAWTDYRHRQASYLSAQEEWFSQLRSEELEQAVTHLWDGDGTNRNATLTVWRHFDSASVAWGLVGDYPSSAWVIDYPLLERIHYLLVAGYDVYGNVGHQLTTRVFMDFLRMEGEDYFLTFLPVSHRKAIRDSWYVGVRAKRDPVLDSSEDWLRVESVTGYVTDDPLRELYQRLEDRLGPMAGPPDRLNRCAGEQCRDPGVEPALARWDGNMRLLAQLEGASLDVFPDVSFVRVRAEGGERETAYTIILNKGYKNLTSVFEDEDRRDRDDDTLTIVRRLEGSYPNFFLHVDGGDLETFIARFQEIRTPEDYEAFVADYGVRRTDRGFWATADWFQGRLAAEAPLRAGVLDLNRYQNR